MARPRFCSAAAAVASSNFLHTFLGQTTANCTLASWEFSVPEVSMIAHQHLNCLELVQCMMLPSVQVSELLG